MTDVVASSRRCDRAHRFGTILFALVWLPAQRAARALWFSAHGALQGRAGGSRLAGGGEEMISRRRSYVVSPRDVTGGGRDRSRREDLREVSGDRHGEMVRKVYEAMQRAALKNNEWVKSVTYFWLGKHVEHKAGRRKSGTYPVVRIYGYGFSPRVSR